MSSDALDARHALEEDMARHESRFAGEVHASRNQMLAAEALEQLERSRAEQVAQPSVAAPEQAPIEHIVQKREINGQRYALDVAPDKTPMYRTSTEFERNVLKHAMPRVDLLLTKRDEGPLGTPSWRTKTLAALYFKIKSHEAFTSGKTAEADIFERAFQQDLYELLEASNQPFGDWRKQKPLQDPDSPLIVAP